MQDQMKRVRDLAHRISAELEPAGGVVAIDGASAEELRAFVREAAGAVWALAMSVECAAQGMEERPRA
jgi:hypothetical protein